MFFPERYSPYGRISYSRKSVQNYEKNSKYARKIAAFSAFERKLSGKSYFFGEKVTSHPLN